MSWTCKLITLVPGTDVWLDAATGQRPVTGDIWYVPDYLTHWRDHLAPYYFANNAHRLPVAVMLPGDVMFVVDGLATKEGGFDDTGWTVTGLPPGMTVQPSIHARGHYHGYLTDGVLSDDVDGRVFL